MSKPTIETTNCVGCGVCIKRCPAKAITITDNKAAIDPAKCRELCATICTNSCPLQIIRR